MASVAHRDSDLHSNQLSGTIPDSIGRLDVSHLCVSAEPGGAPAAAAVRPMRERCSTGLNTAVKGALPHR